MWPFELREPRGLRHGDVVGQHHYQTVTLRVAGNRKAGDRTATRRAIQRDLIVVHVGVGDTRETIEALFTTVSPLSSECTTIPAEKQPR